MVETELTDVIESVAAASGFDVEEIKLTPAGRSRVLRVLVDREGGADLDAIAEVSRRISKELDSEQLLGNGPYTLEVSSPGATRPLTLPRHWRRNLGRLIAVTTADGKRTGRLTSADEASAELVTDEKTWRVEYADVKKARVELEFSHAAKEDN